MFKWLRNIFRRKDNKRDLELLEKYEKGEILKIENGLTKTTE